MSSKMQNWTVPLIAVFLGMIAGAILMLAFGYNPLFAYNDLIYTSLFSSVKNIGEVLAQTGPLILIALGFAVSSKAGFFNVGLPGQALAGWFVAAWFALMHPDLPQPLSLLATVVIALVAGGIIGAIPGILRAYLGTSEVIVTIMMNYIVLYVTQGLIGNFSKSIMRTTEATQKVSQSASYQTELLRNLTGGSHFNLGFFMALIAVILIWFLMKKTKTGYEITAVGLNPDAAQYAGMSAKRTIALSMVISGALSGLGGAVYGLGYFENFFEQYSSLQIGWDGMAVALLASNNPVAIPFAALLYGILAIGKTGMQDVPQEVIDVVSALIIFFVGSNYIIRRYIKPRQKAASKGGKS